MRRLDVGAASVELVPVTVLLLGKLKDRLL